MSKEEFIQCIKNVLKIMKNFQKKEALVVYHADADGVCSGAIVIEALMRDGYDVKSFCLEKIYPGVIDLLHSKDNQLIFYVDLGSPHARKISESNKGRNLVIILDHHMPEKIIDPKVKNVCPHFFDISGDRDASGSTVCYFFAKELNPFNKDLAFLSVIGSVEIPGNLRGLNRETLNDAKNNFKIIKRKEKEDYHSTSFNMSAYRLATLLTVLSSVGYFKGGPEIALKTCLDKKFVPETMKFAKELEDKRKTANKKVLDRIKKTGFFKTKNIQWFHTQDTFKGMGTKVIGSLCSYLRFQREVNPVKYLVGFMNMSKDVPGYGKLKYRKDLVKVSVRTPRILERLVNERKMPKSGELLRKAIEGINGIVGEGHSHAASGIIFKNQEEELIEKMQELIEKR